MADIKYQVIKVLFLLKFKYKSIKNVSIKNDFVIFERSPKGKVPWITLNGVDVSDSQFCIEFLSQNYGKDLSDGLTPSVLIDTLKP